ncbi:MAG: thioredoxin domain-containing protein [Puniceicoccaceae bacterium]
MLPPDGGPGFNRLIHEKSPYLLQHADNPVNWYPWGEEAFAMARKEDKPVFLSIGYATCHWCHVMKRESFEDESVAALLNEHFICIKVDREERPDVDHVYMVATQRLSGQKGWPVTVFMTPDKLPFFAGTYFPKEGKMGQPGFLDLIGHTVKLWQDRRESVKQTAEQMSLQLQEEIQLLSGAGVSEKTLDATFKALKEAYDSAEGGFGRAPKFPTPHKLTFLLRYWKRTGDESALVMAENTLKKLRKGGIYDQVGYGFHRYSVDREWQIPHFEKMLYDQALLAMAYTEAYLATGRETYAATTHEILAYVLRDMTAPKGGFYSAEDAESEEEEGLFYLWKYDEIMAVLGAEDGEWFCTQFNISAEGNFLDPSSRRSTGRNVPFLSRDSDNQPDGVGAQQKRIDQLRKKLLTVRDQRTRPLKDDKILTDWNGLVIAALAQSGMALDDSRYIEAAQRGADFILAHLRQDNGRLWKRYRLGDAGLPAHLDDYAFLVWGLLDLYEATFEVRYLQASIELTDWMLKLFGDDQTGGFFMTASDGEELLFRSKKFADGAIPSGNSVAALNLIRLYRMTGNTSYEEHSQKLLEAISGNLNEGSTSYCQLMCAVDFALGPSVEIVIAGEPGSEDVEDMLRVARTTYFPNKVLLFRPDTDEIPDIAELAPFTRYQESLDGKATVYVCRDFACQAPSTDPRFLRAELDNKPDIDVMRNESLF